MTKEEFLKFKGLPKDIDYLSKKLQRLERDAENVQTVKDKVQSSMKDFPYTPTHVTVDAPEPVKFTRIQREIRRTRKRLERAEDLKDELNEILAKVEDGRNRQILYKRYVDGMTLKDVAIEHDLTEQAVLKIIRQEVKKL